MYKYELYHFGIKGMKWGVRRYQNKDGTLTNAGLKRYDRDEYEDRFRNNDKKVLKDGHDANRWVREDIDRGSQLADASGRLTRGINDVVKTSIKNQPKVKMDLSNMTDKEMRDAINRAMLEKQYNDMFAPQKSTKGREYVMQTLEMAGALISVTGGALAIAKAIADIRGPKQ